MSTRTIRAFNPFSDWWPNSRKILQDIIYYGDSRLRVALLTISTAKAAKMAWAQRRLKKELVRCF